MEPEKRGRRRVSTAPYHRLMTKRTASLIMSLMTWGMLSDRTLLEDVQDKSIYTTSDVLERSSMALAQRSMFHTVQYASFEA